MHADDSTVALAALSGKNDFSVAVQRSRVVGTRHDTSPCTRDKTRRYRGRSVTAPPQYTRNDAVLRPHIGRRTPCAPMSCPDADAALTSGSMSDSTRALRFPVVVAMRHWYCVRLLPAPAPRAAARAGLSRKFFSGPSACWRCSGMNDPESISCALHLRVTACLWLGEKPPQPDGVQYTARITWPTIDENRFCCSDSLRSLVVFS